MLAKETRVALETNQRVRDQLIQIADLLDLQEANPFRVNAYRRAAQTLQYLDTDLPEFLHTNGIDGLLRLRNISNGLARTIHEIVYHGHTSRLDRLQGALQPVQLFQSISGIGEEFANRIHDHLQVDSLESLELAAYDGRLAKVSGVGQRRNTAILNVLSKLLGKRKSPNIVSAGFAPSVRMILDIDAEYREKSSAGKLTMISPRNFNPDGRLWLPILHCVRKHWCFTSLFTNSTKSNELGRVNDWVTVCCYDDHNQEGQFTVVTETRGLCFGNRVVRGREEECCAYYEGKLNRSC